MLALLAELMSVPSAIVAMNMKNRPKKEIREHLFYHRPRPYYKYPFCAKISTYD